MPASLPHVPTVRSPGGHPQTILSLESFARAGVVENDRLPRDRVRIVESNGIGSGPESRLRFNERIGSERIFRIQYFGHRNEIDGRLLPPLGKASVPEWEITQRLDHPY